MKIVLFIHSLVSDWNHGNAHFLRGVIAELLARGHDVQVYEPRDAWSAESLVRERGEAALEDYRTAYPTLRSTRYILKNEPIEADLERADLVIVHEWNSHDLVSRIGAHRRNHGRYRLLFHDTHHRAVTDRAAMAAYDLQHYDGVLAFGRIIRDLYLREGWAKRAWTWHEAADTRLFRPHSDIVPSHDLVWVGNWGDGERTAELQEFLLEPARRLRLDATVYGVRYPEEARQALSRAGIAYRGWLPNYAAPRVFAEHRVTVHVPRRPYVESLPGIPTIRVFEALACGIPLVCAPWNDFEHLFEPGKDFLVAQNGDEMAQIVRMLLAEPETRRELALNGRATIEARHSCAHRVDELMAIARELGVETGEERAA